MINKTIPPKKEKIGFVSRTKQQYKDNANLNIIMGRMPSGQRPDLPERRMFFGDFTAIPDFQEMQNKVASVEEEFMKLPSLIRKRFHHSPVQLLDFLRDPSNMDEGVKLGLFDAPKKAMEPPSDPPASNSQ